MSKKFQYYSDVKTGRLQKNISDRIRNDLKNFEGKRVELTIERQKSKRSISQNAYYWVLVGILSEHTGFTKEEMHDVLKFKFLKVPVIIGDEEVYTAKSTTKLSKSEFMDFIAELQIWASETLNVYLPDPNEQLKANL